MEKVSFGVEDCISLRELGSAASINHLIDTLENIAYLQDKKTTQTPS